ncbi:hypothetical protein EDC94DRAFT_563478 [Helicostylum pulchrum]|uniref:DUF8032 domain-containing protein n=1 Tax=Helicostylum pulchrum TaxID=562976 RepID=A0ABP9XN26_9FUNG|nr:hypothetical protein EDC94DRAFT_563478 [Helicostylum pulchrum]
MSQPNLHLQLCVNDLLHPTEKSESLLEALTSTQLEEIEKTLTKIKEKKQSSTQQLVSPIPITQTANPSALHHDWALVAAQIAKALADTITTATTPTIKTEPEHAKPPKQPCAGISSDKSIHVVANKSPTSTTNTTTTSTTTSNNNSTPTTPNAAAAGSVVPNHEPRTEVREGVEWVSFVYSHHRVLRRYSIRTDVDQVDINLLDDKFKSENCVYPRANLPRDQYKGNRWAYETECNTLGWKLAYLNSGEIAGKRGLIQRAVDSYRNRYPSMRSRRVARQEKLMKGTLRKRKHRESEENSSEAEDVILKNVKKEDTKLDCRSLLGANDLPKTVSIDDGLGGAKYRIRINVDSVSLDSIDLAFRRANCVYPRAMDINTSSPFASQRQLEEARCNELGWKLAWLNPKQLANRKNLLQRVLDVYRSKFLPDLNPRKNSLRMPSSTTTQISMDTDDNSATTLTVAALAAAQEQDITAAKVVRRGSAEHHDDNESLYSGTTDSLDFHDCFSPPSEQVTSSIDTPLKSSSPANIYELTLSVPTSSDELLSGTPHPLFESGHESCRRSISSSSSSGSDLSSPSLTQDNLDDTLFKDSNLFGLYTEPIQLPSAGVVFEHCDYIKTEDENLMIDPLMSQLFHI